MLQSTAVHPETVGILSSSMVKMAAALPRAISKLDPENIRVAILSRSCAIQKINNNYWIRSVLNCQEPFQWSYISINMHLQEIAFSHML